MKRLFLLFSLLPSTVMAGEWNWDISGNAKALYGYSDYIKPKTAHPKNNHTPIDGEIQTSLTYKFDQSNQLAFHLDINGGVDREMADYNQGNWGEEAYFIGDTPYGRLMGGQTYNVGYQFHVGAPLSGVMTANNNYLTDFITNPNWQRNKHETLFSTLNSTAINTDGVAPKMSYITPEFYGTTVGFTYIPESYNRRGLINKAAGYENNSGCVAALYNQQEWGYYTIETSAAYAFYKDIDQEISGGIKVSRGNWSLGGSIHQSRQEGKAEKSQYLAKDFDGFRDGLAWDAGIGYEIGPFSSSLSYFAAQSDKSDAENEVVALSGQFQANKYLNVYLTAARVDFHTENDNLKNNKGYAFIGGLGFSF